jgi:hypothetical protein
LVRLPGNHTVRHHGCHEEDFELWDADGQLTAQARQFAGCASDWSDLIPAERSSFTELTRTCDKKPPCPGPSLFGQPRSSELRCATVADRRRPDWRSFVDPVVVN